MPSPERLVACSGCGRPRPDGTRGCRVLFDELTIRQWDRPVAYRVRRMMVDTYALQHPDEFCASAKSFAAHLTGLCAAMEHPEHETLLRVLLDWLDGPSALEKPALPETRGAVTVDEALEAPDGERLLAAADRWARSTWEAHAALHPLARRWVGDAIQRSAGKPRR